MIHKTSHTYLVDLFKGENFGEVGFFTENPRVCSAKSRDFTEVYLIWRDDFMKIAEDYVYAFQAYHSIRSYVKDEKNYYPLKTECYLCNASGHIFLDCPLYFRHTRGNLLKIFNKLHNKSIYKEDMANQEEGYYIYPEDNPNKGRNPELDHKMYPTEENKRTIKKRARKLRDMQQRRGSKVLDSADINAVFDEKNRFGRRTGDQRVKEMQKALARVNDMEEEGGYP